MSARGSIVQKRPGVWRIFISDGSDDDGGRRRFSRTIKGTKRDAQQALTKLLREADGGLIAEGRQPLASFLTNEWLPTVTAVSKRGRPLAPTTASKYAGAIAHIERVIGAVRLMDMRETHTTKLRDRLLAEGNLAPQTVADTMRVLSQALSYAEARGYVAKNVASARLVNRPVGKRRDFVVIDAELGQRILAAVRGTEWDAPAHLALGLGLRREEVLALRESDIDDDGVHIRQTLTYADGELHIGPPKSDAGRRDLPLPAFVAAALKRHKIAQSERLLALGITTDLVVANAVGEAWMPASFSTGWRRFAKANGFEGVTYHTLRHGAATLLLAGGVPDAVAISVMGHSDTRVLRRYQAVLDDLKQDAAARMDAVLGG